VPTAAPGDHFLPTVDPAVAGADADGRAGRITRRTFLAGAAATPVALWLQGKVPAAAAERAARYGAGPDAACRLNHEVVLRIWRGWRSDRSGQVVVVPHGANYMAGGISHSTPYPYTQNIPMFWYSPDPGLIQARPGPVTRPVTSADVAPTIAELIGFDFQPADPGGTAMQEALVSGAAAPKLVVVLVVDGGGRFVLNLWPDAWPFLKSLKPNGTWYDHASVGSNPSNTAPIHATIGTGTFPMTHGVVDNEIRFPDGVLRDPYALGPEQALLVDALADRYLAAVGTDAAIGMIGTVPWHLGMIGRGAAAGGPQPVVVMKDAPGNRGSESPDWGLFPSVQDFYRFPDYVNDLPPLSGYWGYADKIDGRPDGTWRGHDIASLQGGFHTPARLPYQERVVEEVIRQEGFGTHASPDLLFLNFKLVDEAGHMFFASGIEMRDAVLAQDHQLERLVTFLNKHVGSDWVLLFTADHGHTAAPPAAPSFPINEGKLNSLLRARFDTDHDGVPVVDLIRPIWLNLDTAELRANGATLQDVSRFLAALTKGQTASEGVPLTATEASERVFDAVFAGSLLATLPCLPEAH